MQKIIANYYQVPCQTPIKIISPKKVKLHRKIHLTNRKKGSRELEFSPKRKQNVDSGIIISRGGNHVQKVHK